MKLNGQFTLAKLGAEYMAVPLDNTEKNRIVIKLNESGAEVFQGLIDGQDEEQLAERLRAKYGELDAETARKAVNNVLDSLKKAGILIV